MGIDVESDRGSARPRAVFNRDMVLFLPLGSLEGGSACRLETGIILA